ncbi:MAG: M23 family metallopeptidase, partial [Anaerolineae bacterium]|nr:M23 family metallopeptidase [Anaerolineae bacterium]
QHARHDASNPVYSGTQLWDAVARYPWPVEPGDDPPPADDGDPFADYVEVVPPGDSRYLDGVYQGSTIRFHGLSSEFGPVKYAETHPQRSTLWAQWVPGITRSGRYEIAVFVPGTHATTRRARYHVRGIVGQDSTVLVELDQSKHFDVFVPLGVFDLDGARPDSGAVNLTNLTGESERAVAFSPIRWTLLEEQTPGGTADGYDAPVGTAAERAARGLWPGRWLDANPFGRRYPDGPGTTAYHTGADLNLNLPEWDADRRAPVYAIASGTVTFAGYKPVWGKVIVIRHDPPQPDGNPVWARYAHVAALLVETGDRVQRGQQIATVGKPEPEGAPYHLHFDICTSGVLEENPLHWPRLNRAELTAHYVDPLVFLRANRPPGR